MVIFVDPGSTWAIHLIAGHARFADDSGLPDMAAGDSALLQAGDKRQRHVLDGAGEALLTHLQPLPGIGRDGRRLALTEDDAGNLPFLR